MKTIELYANGINFSALKAGNADAKLLKIIKKWTARFPVPTLAIYEAEDIRGEVIAAQKQFFSGEYEYEIIPDCGNFPHREKQSEINKLLTNWLED